MGLARRTLPGTTLFDNRIHVRKCREASLDVAQRNEANVAHHGAPECTMAHHFKSIWSSEANFNLGKLSSPTWSASAATESEHGPLKRACL
jgi:hypothetical protein